MSSLKSCFTKSDPKIDCTDQIVVKECYSYLDARYIHTFDIRSDAKLSLRRE